MNVESANGEKAHAEKKQDYPLTFLDTEDGYTAALYTPLSVAK